MSFVKSKELIDEGDTVILYLTAINMHAIDVMPQIKNKKGEMVENIFQTSFGALKIRNLIGKKYGTKIQLTRGWAYVLQPCPNLWTQTLPHRTQIIYTPDISMILFQLDIKPGSIVIESGTGSGSLSHFLIHAMKPHGYLHTFDFHEKRAEQARTEFKNHALNDFVTVYHRDVCEFGFTDNLNGCADAVFLDLPAPQICVPHAKKAMKKLGIKMIAFFSVKFKFKKSSESGRFCSFSPCIEQSQRCCEALQIHGFEDIVNMELLQIESIVKMKTVQVLDLEFTKHKKLYDCPVEKEKEEKENKKYISSSAPQTMPGHTGYLTFASLPAL